VESCVELDNFLLLKLGNYTAFAEKICGSSWSNRLLLKERQANENKYKELNI
jgi:hypothetical protein